jgi:hypothetical protein
MREKSGSDTVFTSLQIQKLQKTEVFPDSDG